MIRVITIKQQVITKAFFCALTIQLVPWHFGFATPSLALKTALGMRWANSGQFTENGETNTHIAVKQEVPFRQCTFSSTAFFVEISNAQLKPGELHGVVSTRDRSFAWDLTYAGNAKSLLFLPLNLYKTRLPSAKSLVSAPMATFNGSLTVNDETVEIVNWIGSQNHNWGTKHTDLYAWGQVAGFDSHPHSFLEVATARLKIGPLLTPYITLAILRHNGQEFALNSLFQSLRAKGSFKYFSWNIKSETKEIGLEGLISAPPEAFVGLNYYNPPGGNKHCLNTKIASCQLILKDKRTGKQEILVTNSRAAFEILTDDRNHGIVMQA
ncbi:MAG: hypothetical protein ACXVBU_07090 [Ktedonobacteraceae bacterium]